MLGRNLKILIKLIRPLVILSLAAAGMSTAAPVQADTVCPPGTYVAPYDATICNETPPGTYTAVADSSQATLCPIGSYQPFYGQTSCLVPPAGSANPNLGSVAPEYCSFGFFEDSPGSTGCERAPIGKYVSGFGSSSTMDCPATPANATLSNRLGNSGVLDCFNFSGNSLVLPLANSTVENKIDIAFYSNSLLGGDDNVRITFTGTTDPNPVYQIVAKVSANDIDGKIGSLSIPLAWTNTNFFKGCSLSCAETPLTEITSLPLATYSIKIEAKNNTNTWNELGTVNSVVVSDTRTTDPLIYLQAWPYFPITDSATVSVMLPEARLADSAIIKISNKPSHLSPTLSRVYHLGSGELGRDIVLPFSGEPTSLEIVSVSGATITPGQWWVSVSYQDFRGQPVASDEWHRPMLITRDCPEGNFSVNGIAPCIPAPAGYYVDYPSLDSFGSETKVFSPSPCGLGSYQPNPGSAACEPADPGTYVDRTASKTTTDCPEGTFQPSAGSIDCLQAIPGTYVPQPKSTATTDCEPGTYQPSSSSRECLQADPGTYVDQPKSTTTLQCPLGKYQPSAGTTECLPTDAGSYTNRTGSIDPILCAKGTYQPESGQTSCIRASAGNYVPSTGLSSQTKCASGTYQPSPGAAECIPAEAGSYTNETGSVATTLCDAGSYQSEAGQTSCVLASANHFVASAGQVSQTPCASGYGQPNIGSTSCDAIPAPGNSTPAPGNSTPVVCPALTYSSVGATSVADCQPKPCVVPKGKSATTACMLASIAKVLPAKAKVKIKMSKSFKKNCKVNKTRVKALKAGTCTVTITVKPKKGKSIKYRVNVTGI